MRRFLELFHKLCNGLYCLLCSGGHTLVVNGWLHVRYGRTQQRNFGDELNVYLLRALTGRTIISYYDIPHLRPRPDLLCIGSIVEEFTTPQSVIWGSGAISGVKPLRHKPARVCAVRGRLTRDYLLRQGVACPEVYGDPALLLPLVYRPQVRKKYKVGLIPHVHDLQHPAVRKLASDKDVHLIRLCHYGDWRRVVDELCACEVIASSSLHGLIVADAYGVPNVWIRLSDAVLGGSFKFMDYFSGVGRTTAAPLPVDERTTADELRQQRERYIPIAFNAAPLLAAAPFAIKRDALCQK